jgi:hypothetical protein
LASPGHEFDDSSGGPSLGELEHSERLKRKAQKNPQETLVSFLQELLK